MRESSAVRKSGSGLLLLLLPFTVTVLVFSFVDSGATLEVHRTALVLAALMALALTVLPAAIRSTNQLRDGGAALAAIPAYRLVGSWKRVVILRCFLVGVGAVLCAYLWIRLVGQGLDGKVTEVEAILETLSAGGSPKGGCSLRATLRFDSGVERICVSHRGHEPLLVEHASAGEIVRVAVKNNYLSTSVVALKVLE